MASYQLNPQLLFDTLLCEEDHWDEEEELTHSSEKNCTLLEEELNNKPFMEWEDEELSFLLNKEQENELYNDPSLAKARGEAVEWMLKVNGYYSFSAITAVLAVNYLDRFLHSFQAEKPWMTQLAAVACLSLAAKVEETQVPLLLDLQVESSKYVFESKTIQRMEILILSTLQWKMNPVTPLSFLDYFARRLGLNSKFLRRCECLLLSVVSDCRFMCYLPSTLASATMMYVISCLDPCIAVDYQDQLLGILGINKDKVEECCRVIEEVATGVDFYSSGSMPGTPKGVVDLSFSSDTSNECSCPLTSIASVSSSPNKIMSK